MYDNLARRGTITGSTLLKKKQNTSAAISSGGAIVIIIFLILCLTIFSMLSFSAAFADKKLADKNIQSISIYYDADSESEIKFAQIYDSISAHVAEMEITNEVSFSEFLTEALTGFDGIEIENSEQGGIFVSYVTPMNDSLAYYTNVLLYLDADSKKLEYDFYARKVIVIKEFEYGNADYENLWVG